MNKTRQSLFKEVIVVLSLIVLAFGIRLFFLQFKQAIGTDSYFYLTCGKNLIEGKGFVNMDGSAHLTFAPLASFIIGVFYLITNNLELSGRLVSVLFGSLLILPVYLIAKTMRDTKIAVLTSVFSVFYPGLINISTQVGSDSLYSFLLAWLVYYFWKALNKKDRDWVYFVYVGALLGLCYLTRAVGLIYFFIIILWLITFFLIKRINFIHAAKNIFVCLFAFVAIASPYFYFTYRHTGTVSLSPNAGIWLNMDVSKSEEEIEIAKTSITGKEQYKTDNSFNLMSYFIKYPKAFSLRVIKNNLLYYKKVVPKEFTPLILIFLGLGILGLVFNKERFFKDVFIVSLFFPVSFQILWNLEPRYLIPLMPYAMIFVASGLYYLKDNFLNTVEISKRLRSAIFLLMAGIIIALFFLSSINSVILNSNDGTIEHKKAGLWLKNFDHSHFVVMARKPYVSFYSEGLWVCLPYADYSEIIRYAKKNNIKYLVIDELSILKLRPQLAFLLDENKATSDLKLIYKDHSSGRLIIIYQLL